MENTSIVGTKIDTPVSEIAKPAPQLGRGDKLAQVPATEPMKPGTVPDAFEPSKPDTVPNAVEPLKPGTVPDAVAPVA